MMNKNEIELDQKQPFLEQLSPEYFKSLFKIDNDIAAKRKKVDDYDRLGKYEGILDKLKTNKSRGLNSENKNEIEEKIKVYGSNKKPEIIDRSYFEHVMNSFEDQMLRILLLAAAVSLIIGIFKDGIETGWIEGTAIFFAVSVVVNITSYMNSREEKEFNKLSRMNRERKVELIRSGKSSVVDTQILVVGDIISYKVGDMTDVDAIMVENNGIEVDESSLTGESKEIKKTFSLTAENITTGPFIYSGCAIKKGNCKAVVVCVGANTTSRQAEAGVDNTKQTPLQAKLDDLKDDVSKVAYFVAIMIGIIMIAKEVSLRFFHGQQILDSTGIDIIINAFIISISILVVALPEGLPMAVTLSLTHSMQQMIKEKNMVKYVDSSETMGNVNELCSDKTGTLTTGEMILARAYFLGNEFNLEKNDNTNSNPSDSRNIKGLIDLQGPLLDFIHLNVLKNITKYEMDEKKGKFVVHGSMTDQGYMNFIDKNKINIAKFQNFQSHRKDLHKVEFSSDEKFMASSIYLEKQKKYRVLIKGAFDYFNSQNKIGMCVVRLNPDTTNPDLAESYDLEITQFEAQRKSFEDYVRRASESCYRSIFFGYKDIPEDEYNDTFKKHSNDALKSFKEFFEKDIIMCGILSFYDPPRENIQTSIQKCLGAGVNLRMITGDDIKTAIAISFKIGILTKAEYNLTMQQKPTPTLKSNASEDEEKRFKEELDNYYRDLENLAREDKLFCLEGAVFNKIAGGIRENPNFDKKKDVKDGNQPYELCDQEKFRKVIKNLKVIARCANDNKLLLVFGLKKLNNIVAVTGDGTNDAIALKNSDVGFAMGIRGTDVAKCAADIILLDDSFTSIITAIKYGRNVFDSIRKFVQFQLTTNIVAIFMTLLGGIVLKDSPLNPIQMLWVNLIMDSFASLALATEPPSEELLKRKPYQKTTPIVTQMMKVNIVSQAILQIVILLIILFFGDILFGVPSDRELNHFTWNENVGYHFTIFFNTFVFLQVFNSINSRKLQKKEANIFVGIFNNPYYLGIQVIIVVGQILMIQFGGRAVRTQPLTLMQHLGCISIGSISLVLGFIMKKLPYEVEEGDSVVKEKTISSKSRISASRQFVSSKV